MNEDFQEKTRYEIFLENAKSDISKYRKELMGDGSFDYINQVTELQRLSNNMNSPMLVYLFGEQLGNHLAEKFVVQCNGNLLNFLCKLTTEIRFFILYSLKNDKNLLSFG